jgi:hypothetical protein
MAGEHLCQRALAGAVWAHDRVNFACVDGQVDTLENLGSLDRHVQIFDL